MSTPPAVPAPTSPGTLSQASEPTLSSSTATFSWGAVSGATSYEVAVRDLATNQIIVDQTVSGTSYQTTLSSGGSYRWNVDAINSAGASTFSSPLYFLTPASVSIPAVPAPTSPGTLSQASEPTLSSSTATFSWGAVSGATSYEVAVRDLATNQIIVDQTVSGTSYQTSLSSGGSYRWNVDAINSAGASTFSSPLYFLTPASVSIPAVPAPTSPGTLSQASEPTLSSSTATFSWGAVSGATSYEVAVRDLATNQIIVDQTVSGTSYQTTLSSGGSYRWNVDAINSAGASTFSSPLYFLTPASVSGGTVDPYIPYTDADPAHPTPSDVVAAALQYQGALWAPDNCTGLVWAVATAVAAPYYQTILQVTGSAAQPATVPDPATDPNVYVVPPTQPVAGTSLNWELLPVTSDWQSVAQPGDLVRIPKGILQGSPDGHSFIVVGKDSQGHWLVIDDTDPNHQVGDTEPITITEHSFNTSNTLYGQILNASTAYVSRLKASTISPPPAVPVPSSPGTSSQASEPTLSSSTVTLSWSAVTSATSYEVAVRDLGTNQIVVDQTVSGTSYQASLSSGGSYRWNVDAINSAGASTFSSPLYFLTPSSPPLGSNGIDYRVQTGTALSGVDVSAIQSDGYQFVGEYIGNASNSGYLTQTDAPTLGLPIVSIYERSPDRIGYFTTVQADADANSSASAITAAENIAHQPLGTAIYFTVDPAAEAGVYSGFGALSSDYINAIELYFQRISGDFANQANPYKIGIYGPGDVLTAVHSLQLPNVDYYWVDTHWGTSFSGANIQRDQNQISASPISIGVSVDTDTALTSEFGQWNSTSPPPNNYVTDDFNGDGKTDILWRNNDGEVGSWVSNPGSSTALTYQDFGVSTSDWAIQGVGDFNNDGKADILWQNDVSGQVGLWVSNAGSSPGFSWQDVGQSTSDWSIQGLGDFNGDGKPDILWRNNDGEVGSWVSNPGSSTALTYQDFGVSTSDWAIQGVGDFNNDGKADILWQNDVSGQVGLWVSNAGSSPGFSWQDVGQSTSDWSIQGLGDFNGDGKPDILWRNNDGEVGSWVSNRGSSTALTFQDIGFSTPDWTIQGIGDFNSDGRADILWRNNNTNDVGLWVPTAGSTAFSWQDLGQSTPDWSIQNTRKV